MTKVGHYRKMLKSSPRPARGIFPYGGGGPRAGTPCQGGASVLPGAQGGASRKAPRSRPEPPRGPRAVPPPRGRGPAGGTARPFPPPSPPRTGGGSPRAEGASCEIDSFSPAPPSDEPAGGREMVLPPPGGGGARPSPGARAPPRRPPRARGRGGGGSPREVAAERRARGPACAPANPRCAGEGASRPAGEELRREVCLRAGAEVCGPGPRRRRPGRAGPEPALPWEDALPAGVVRGRGR